MEFSVLSPLGKQVGTAGNIAPRLPDLNGKTIGEVWNGMFRGDVLFPALRELLKKRYPDIKFVPYTELPDVEVWTNLDQRMDGLKEALKQKGVDAVISGVGA